MTTFPGWTSSFSVHDLAQSLGWTLLHFCWQGAAVALVLWCALRLMDGRAEGLGDSRLRYAASCLALAAMVALPVATFGHLWTEARAARAIPVASFDLTVTAESGGSATPVDWRDRVSAALDEAAPWLPAVWLGGMMVFLVRLSLGMVFAQRMRTAGTTDAPEGLVAVFRQMAARLGVRRVVKLLHSARVQVPTVIGWLEPVVLIPVGCLTGLSKVQIEALLAHELAHIGRHDYLMSVLQSVVEAVLFYHPAVWWVSKQVRRERECCCDELAVRTAGDALAYAKALSFLETRRSYLPEVALGANGGVLTMRIRRLLGYRESGLGSQMVAAAVLAVMVGAGGMMVANAARAQTGVEPGSTAVEQNAPAAPAVVPAPDAKQRKLSVGMPVKQDLDNHGRIYMMWLHQDVVWIITPEEHDQFLRLTNDDERDRFIGNFWLRRNAPGTPANSFREEHYARIAYANQHFRGTDAPGWSTDRGHIYIAYGKPESIDSHPSGGDYQRPAAEGGGTVSRSPFEVWHYASAPAGTGEVNFEFVDSCGCGDFRLEVKQGQKAVQPVARAVSYVRPGVGAQTASDEGRGGGSIVGVVMDPTGAVLPRVKITVTGGALSSPITVFSDNAGRYTVAPLPAGAYSIDMEAVGFHPVRPIRLSVDAGVAVPVNVKMDVAASSETVYVMESGGQRAQVNAAVPSGPVRVSGGLMAGNLVSKVDPVYPAEAKAAHVQGAVVLHAIVSKTGTVENLTVVSGPDALRASALDAVRRWTYKPYLLNGQPVEVETTVTVNYTFGGDSAYLAPGQAAPGQAAASGAASGRPQRVSSGVMAGAIISRVDPVYPPEAKAAGVQGAVVLRAMIAKTGLVENLEVVSGPQELAGSAIDAVKQWVYKPYLLNGEPTEVETTITVNYSLAGGMAAVPGPDAGGAPNRIGGRVSAPTLISQVSPEFTKEARKAKVSGNVLVNMMVDDKGLPTNVRVIRGLGVGRDGTMDPKIKPKVADGMNQKALEAVSQYRFKPAMKDGRPVAVELNVEVNFQIF